MLLRPLVAGGHPAPEDVEAALHHAQRIAQLVADGADQLAEGGEPLVPRLLREEVLAIRVQHDRQLEIEDLAQRHALGAEHVRFLDERGVDDGIQLLPEHVHRAEHVVLRERDVDVLAANAGAKLVVIRAPGAGEELLHPRDERVPQTADHAFAFNQGLSGRLVLEDALVEDLADALELGPCDGVQHTERQFVGRAKPDVALQLLEEGFRHDHLLCNRPAIGEDKSILHGSAPAGGFVERLLRGESQGGSR